MADHGDPLGGPGDFAASVVSLPTVLALFAVFFSAMQGMLALESADPCRLSVRKMNILLGLEAAEIIVSVTAELLSFFELRTAFRTRLTWLQWVPSCLLAAGLLETFVNLYFTLAVLTKNRVNWMPFSAAGGENKWWEILPFLLTFALSACLMGWRLRWWWQGNGMAEAIGVAASQKEVALRRGPVGFAVGWTVGVSGLVFLIILLSDCADDGASYIAGLRYLWHPDEWLPTQHGDIKIWYRRASGAEVLQQYVSTAVLDASVVLPATGREMHTELGKRPLHCGNAIMGGDQELVYGEDRRVSRLHFVILLAEHFVVLPLLFLLVVVVVRLHETLDKETFNAIRQLAENAIILAFLEIAVGVKNIIWSTCGISKEERRVASKEERLESLKAFYLYHTEAGGGGGMKEL